VPAKVGQHGKYLEKRNDPLNPSSGGGEKLEKCLSYYRRIAKREKGRSKKGGSTERRVMQELKIKIFIFRPGWNLEGPERERPKTGECRGEKEGGREGPTWDPLEWEKGDWEPVKSQETERVWYPEGGHGWEAGRLSLIPNHGTGRRKREMTGEGGGG